MRCNPFRMLQFLATALTFSASTAVAAAEG